MKNSLVMDLANSLGLTQQYLANQGAVDAVVDVIQDDAVARSNSEGNVNKSFSNYKQSLFMNAANPQGTVGGV